VKNRTRNLAASLAAALVATGVAACGGGSDADASGGSGDSTIVLGEIAALTGAAEAVGGPQHNGIVLAVEQINADGGIDIGGDKVKIDLKTEDTKSDPTVGVTVVQKLLSQENAHFLIGTLNGAVASAYVPIIEKRDDVIDVVVGAANPGLNENLSVYRPRVDAFQNLDNEVALALQESEKNAGPVGIVYDSKLDSNTEGVPRIEKGLKDGGAEVAGPFQFELGAAQFNSQVAALVRSGAGVVLFQGYASDLMTFVKQAREQKYDGVIVAASGATKQQVKDADVPSSALDGVLDIGTPFPADLVALGLNAKAAKSFADAYQEKFDAPPGYTSASAYGGVYILARALSAAGTTSDFAKIRQALDDLKVSDVPELAEAIRPQDGDRIFADHQAFFKFVLHTWDGSDWKTTRVLD
jgi:branched-chain amino acid transport system substrate-binding protein